MLLNSNFLHNVDATSSDATEGVDGVNIVIVDLEGIVGTAKI